MVGATVAPGLCVAPAEDEAAVSVVAAPEVAAVAALDAVLLAAAPVALATGAVAVPAPVVEFDPTAEAAEDLVVVAFAPDDAVFTGTPFGLVVEPTAWVVAAAAAVLAEASAPTLCFPIATSAAINATAAAPAAPVTRVIRRIRVLLASRTRIRWRWVSIVVSVSFDITSI